MKREIKNFDLFSKKHFSGNEKKDEQAEISKLNKWKKLSYTKVSGSHFLTKTFVENNGYGLQKGSSDLIFVQSYRSKKNSWTK